MIIRLLAFSLVACGPSREVEVTLRVTHPDPAAVREVLSTRFRHARDAELLPIRRASAKLAPPGLLLEAAMGIASCDEASIESMKLALIDLTITRHVLAVHRVAPDRAEALAAHLRDRLGADVSTPLDRPGLLVVAAPIARIIPHLPTDGSAIFDGMQDSTDSSSGSALWAVDPTPVLDGRAVATAVPDVGSDHAAIDVTFTEQGGAAMHDLTDAAFGQHLVFVVDGRLALAPRVMERITRTLRLELPSAERERALTLARAIAASNFDEPPKLVSAEARCIER